MPAHSLSKTPARSGRGGAPSRLPLYALLGIAAALVVVHVAAAMLQDLPIWDESCYLDWGRHYWTLGYPLTLPQSPGYSLLLGTLSFAVGPALAIRLVAVGSALAFGGAIGAIAFLRWRTLSAGVFAGVLALGSAHAFGIGVHRTAMAILLFGAVALASEKRKVLGHGAFVASALVAFWFRPEVVWAVPILPLAIWGLAPGSRPRRRAVRLGYVGAVAGLAILASVLAARAGADRNWLAFMQHYAAYRQPQLSQTLGPSFSPWFDYEKVIAIDFPGATSLLSAWRAAPLLVLRFLLSNAKTAATLAFESMAAPPRALPVVLAIAAAILVLTAVSRARDKSARKGSGWLVLGMIATSATAFEVVSNGRHVIGLSIALAFGLGLLASERLAGRRFAPLVPVIIGAASLVFAYADSEKLVRYAKVTGYPVSTLTAAVERKSGGRALKVAGQCNVCICAYAPSGCMELGEAQGFTAENQCALFEKQADIVSLRIDDGADAAPPCRAVGYEMLGRWPTIGMEVWARTGP